MGNKSARAARKADRWTMLEHQKKILCSFCRPHRGENATKRRPKDDRTKNKRRGHGL